MSWPISPPPVSQSCACGPLESGVSGDAEAIDYNSTWTWRGRDKGRGDTLSKSGETESTAVSPPVYYFRLARNVHEHFSAGFNLQFLAAFDREGAGAARAANDQTDRRALATPGNATDDRANRGADTRTFDRL